MWHHLFHGFSSMFLYIIVYIVSKPLRPTFFWATKLVCYFTNLTLPHLDGLGSIHSFVFKMGRLLTTTNCCSTDYPSQWYVQVFVASTDIVSRSYWYGLYVLTYERYRVFYVYIYIYSIFVWRTVKTQEGHLCIVCSFAFGNWIKYCVAIGIQEWYLQLWIMSTSILASFPSSSIPLPFLFGNERRCFLLPSSLGSLSFPFLPFPLVFLLFISVSNVLSFSFPLLLIFCPLSVLFLVLLYFFTGAKPCVSNCMSLTYFGNGSYVER